MGRHVVCAVSELPPGERKIVEVEGRSIGVFNVKGSFYAVRNRCPHKGAPLCNGLVKGLVLGPEPYHYVIEREGEILKCPWHGWEFDLTNGRSIYNPHKIRVKSYDVTVEPADDEDLSIETYAVSIERELVVLHVN
ncbi:MAG TPA: Rieske (2Fe-2S) protein [Chloroflexota bacterium]|nr:Rieske (2Fe-2S) protein [Chloroflexota bacterium]